MTDQPTNVAPWSDLRRNPVLIGLAAFLASACVKLSALNSRELWLDETYSAYVATLPLRELRRLLPGDVHPPLYNLLLWSWVHLAGDSEPRMRLFGVLISIAATFVAYLLGRKVLGAWAGTFAGALFAFSPVLFTYSLEVRDYMLFLLVLLWVLNVHWSVVIERRRTRRRIVLYSFTLALLFFVHYLAGFIMLALFLHSLLRALNDRRQIATVFAAGLLTLLFISPGLPLLRQQYGLQHELRQQRELAHHQQNTLSFSPAAKDDVHQTLGMEASAIAVMAGFFPATSRAVLILCALPLVATLGLATWLGLRWRDPVCVLFLLLSASVLAGTLMLHLSATRYLLAIVPPLVLACARALQWLQIKWHRTGLLLGTLVLAVYIAGFMRQRLRTHGTPWQNAVDTVRAGYAPGDAVVFDVLYGQVPFDYFAHQSGFHPREEGFPISIYQWWTMWHPGGWGGPVIQQADLDRFISGLSSDRIQTVWLVSFESVYYDPREQLLDRMRHLGRVEELPLPHDPDELPGSDRTWSIRIYRAQLAPGR